MDERIKIMSKYLNKNGTFNHGKWQRALNESVNEANDYKAFVDEIYKAVGVIDKVLAKNKPPKVPKDIWGRLYGLAEDMTEWTELIVRREEDDERRGKVNETKFEPGAKYSNDFDYQGMLEYGSTVKLPTIEADIKELYLLEESFTDVNYHKEVEFLSSALEFHESGQYPQAQKELLKFNEACIQTLKDYE